MNGFTWLFKVSLVSRDVFLSDGGVTPWAGDTYRPEDADLGRIVSVSELSEGGGDEIPALSIVFAPPSSAAAGLLIPASLALRPFKLWLAEYDTTTGLIVGDPELRFTGNLDVTRIQYALRELLISQSVTQKLEVLFFRNNGNGLSAQKHKQLYPGETGHDQATGLVRTFYWGVQSPRGISGGTGGGSGRGGFGEQFLVNFQ